MKVQPVEVGRILLKEIHEKQSKIDFLMKIKDKNPEIMIGIKDFPKTVYFGEGEVAFIVNVLINILIDQVSDLKKEFKKL